MRELIDAYKKWIVGSVEEQANAHTIASLAKHINRRARDKLSGKFIPHASTIGGKEQLLDLGQLMHQADKNVQERPGRRT